MVDGALKRYVERGLRQFGIEIFPPASTVARELNLAKRQSVDFGVVNQWGRLQQQAGRPLPAVDGLLAATALHHNLILVTRNIKEFAGTNVSIINPWDAG